MVVARELTKIYEEFIRGTASEVMAAVSQGKVRGEVVILIAPGEACSTGDRSRWNRCCGRLMAEGTLSVKDAAKQAAVISGVSRSEAYS